MTIKDGGLAVCLDSNDKAIRSTPHTMTETERIEHIATAILHYLAIRPNAADTTEGIHHWWIDWGAQEEPMAITEMALKLLLERGQIGYRELGGRRIWRREVESN